MSFTVMFDIWCDVCGNWVRGTSTQGKRGLRKSVQSEGWTYVKGIGDLCLHCTEERKLNG